MTAFLVILVSSFLIGSVPSGYLVGKFMGRDIRKEGSGNTGATNAARTLGKKAGIVTLVIDLFKGAIPTLTPIIYPIGQLQWSSTTPENVIALQAIFGLAAILGHCYSPFLLFKGGKGVATGLGVFLVIATLETFIAILVFAGVVKKTRFVSLASIIAVASLALLVVLRLFSNFAGITVVVTLAVTLIIINRHRANIARLIEGTEPKFNLSKKE